MRVSPWSACCSSTGVEMLPLLLICLAIEPVPVVGASDCPTCPQHRHDHASRFPVPDADTHQLLGGPPAPVQQLGAVPPRQSVRLANASLLDTYMEQNLDYLLNSFTVDHMLYNFRLRAGVKAPPSGGRKQGWDANLKGSNAGRFLMGAGNTLRWREHTRLRTMMDAVVEGIYECRNKSNGYIMAYHEPGFMHSEQGDYGRSWVTQGLIEAGKAGNMRAFPMLRAFYDWFNDPEQNPYLPYLYDGVSNAEQGQIASTRMYLETPHSKYADSQTAQDTYRDDHWLRQLIAKEPTSMSNYWMPEPNHPHCYEITAFLAMHDNWRATHNATWLAAAKGAYDTVIANFLNVDGTSALREGRPDGGTDWHPKSYPLRSGARTGETCCSTFWIKFCQRFQLISPWEEEYSAEIEKTLYNALLRQIKHMTDIPDGLSLTNDSYTGYSFLSFVNLGGSNDPPRVPVATCCEGQGSRALGSLPEYIFTLNASVPTDGFYLNLFAPSTLTLNVSVVDGVAPNLPPAPTPLPQPPATLPPPLPPPPLTWEQVAVDGCHSCVDAYHSGFRTLKDIGTFDECKQKCIDSGHPNACMAISWSGSTAPAAAPPPAPPSPLPCESGCAMKATADKYFVDGAFSRPVALSVDACNAKCLKDPRCVQVTMGPGATRCVLYEALYGTRTASKPGVTGFIKCAKPVFSRHTHLISATGGVYDGEAVCTPHLSPKPVAVGGSCVLYRSVDLTVGPQERANVSQWLLHGRRNQVEHDWIASPPPPPIQSPPRTKSGTATMQIIVDTSFPFDDAVSITLRWADEKVHTVALHPRIRMPSWLSPSAVVPVRINDLPAGEGKPGTYMLLDKAYWANGDVITFALPRRAQLIMYPASGIDNIKGYEKKRHALKVGPIVLACVGKIDHNEAIVLPLDATTDPATWLVPVPGAPLQYTVKGVAEALFVPPWMIGNRTYTMYPVFAK